MSVAVLPDFRGGNSDFTRDASSENMGLKIKSLLTENVVYRYPKTVFNNPRLKW
jgi:hypothetical protein